MTVSRRSTNRRVIRAPVEIIEETQEAEARHARAAALKPRRQTVRLLRRDLPVLAADDGTLCAEDGLCGRLRRRSTLRVEPEPEAT